jgi:site-specific DNA recombinase
MEAREETKHRAGHGKMTAALYAQFSSDMQKKRSIEDQLVTCRRYAAREGYKIIGTYSDEAKSATTMFDRDGLRDLMAAAKRREFNAVIVEATDRLSRTKPISLGYSNTCNSAT